MPLATLADLEAIRGPAYVRDLLNSGVDKAAPDEPTRTAQRTARLNAALDQGDQLVRQFLDLDAILTDATATAVLRRLAIDEAIYYLKAHSQAGTTPEDEERAQMRRTDLAAMRKREQFPAKPLGQTVITSGVVEATSSISRAGLRGYY